MGRGRYGQSFVPIREGIYRASIVEHVKKTLPSRKLLEGALIIHAVFQYKKSKQSKLVHVTKKPDLSNLIKSLEDALNGVLWVDDSQIVTFTAQKVWGPEDGVSLEVTEID